MTLFDLILDDRAADPHLGLPERFAIFHARNPHVYEELERMTQQLWDLGRRRFSVKTLIETMRWQYLVQTTGDDFAINNSWSSFYARLLVERNPQWSELFEFRGEGHEAQRTRA